MNQSQHARSPLARALLAVGGIGAFLAAAGGLYAVDTLIGGFRGLAAGVILACGLTAVCGLVFRETTPRHQVITRPGAVRLPEPAADDLKPANVLS